MNEFSTGRLGRMTLVTAAVLLLLVTAWVSVAPLQGAVVAPGHVRAQDRSKPVQHLSGGRIASILVKEGDAVVAGQKLATLDVAREQTSLVASLKEYLHIRVGFEVAAATLQDENQPNFPDEVLHLARRLDMMGELKRALTSYEGEMVRHRQQLSLLTSREDELKSQISSGKARREATGEQLAILEEQRDAFLKLSEDRMVGRLQLDNIRQQIAAGQADIAAVTGQLDQLRSRLDQLGIERRILVQERRARANGVIQDAEIQRARLDGRIKQLKDTIAGAQLVARVDGVVTHLNHHSPGELLPAGGELMQILPRDEALVIEARVKPDDIDEVFRGQDARVMLTAFSLRETPLLEGTVLTVSPDRRQAPDGTYFFTVDIEVQTGALAASQLEALTAGMSAESFLVSRERTVLDYLVAPLSRGINRSLREA